MNWLSKIFAAFGRTERHADRIDSAMEGIADDLEEVRRRLRERIGLEPLPDQQQLPAPEAPAPRGNGRRSRAEA